MDVATGIALLACAAVAVGRGRPTATLLAAAGGAWLLGCAVDVFVFLHRGPLIQLVLAYPAWRARRWSWLVACGYAAALIEPVGAAGAVTVALAAAVVAAAVARRRVATGIERRAARAALVGAALLALALAGATIARAAGADPAAALAGYELAIVLCAAYLAGELWLGRWTQSITVALLESLGRRELGRAVGDPTLALAWRDGDGFVDRAGGRVVPGRRVATAVGDDVVLLHAPEALADSAVAEATVAAARIALRNAALQDEAAAQVVELEASARRLVSAADTERRRLAREVSEEAHARLVTAAATLAVVDPALARETAAAGDELRAFAAGLRPRALASGGLAAALGELVAHSSVPVGLVVPTRRFSELVETTVYFVCSEALANVVKHAGATRVEVEIAERDGGLEARVTDDGRGGADVAQGHGLRGLHDRVHAQGGTFSVTSAEGAGTTLTAVVPA
ncbi:sensor histidine kinase [Solirubrobacter soli]|uniref:sensor histidine kinase n=1 Tax=Solirubrobacter soli TaxID=363832 RepID=UPI00042685A3|nr:ATP-binding protein [Solirubrobacter soli]